MRFLKDERLIKMYGYRSISGRGVKPAEYYLHPKTSCSVLDLRAGELNLYIYSVPRFKTTVISPKIRADRPLSDKADILVKDCFDLMMKSVSEKYLISFSVLTDKISLKPDDFPEDLSVCLPDELPKDTFHFSSEQIEADSFSALFPEKSILYFHISEERREAMIFKDGEILYSEDVSANCSMENRNRSIPQIAASLLKNFPANVIMVFSPYMSTALKNSIAEKCRSEGISIETEIRFTDETKFDVRKETARKTIDILTRGTKTNNNPQEKLL